MVLGKLVVDGRQISIQDGWRSAPGVEALRFHYAVPTFVAPRKIRYMYRLRGLSEDWVFADTLRVAQYAHLVPGEYVFEVKAIGGDGGDRTKPATFRFYLTPYFYQTQLCFWLNFIYLH